MSSRTSSLRRAAAAALPFLATLAMAQPSAAAEKRPLPEYDPRPKPTSTSDVLLWGPRVVVSPLYLVTEYLVRRPLGLVVRAGERWFSGAPDAPDTDRRWSLRPMFVLDLGFRPRVGLVGELRNSLVSRQSLRGYATFGGITNFAVGAASGVEIAGPAASIDHIRFELVRRNDLVFHGIGPRAPIEARQRYATDRIEVASSAEVRPWRASLLRIAIGWRSVRFVGPPAEFTESEGVTARDHRVVFERLLFALDTRALRASQVSDEPIAQPRRTSGLRVEGEAEHATDVGRREASSWLRFGGALTAFVDVTGSARVLSAAVRTTLADPLAGGTLPFTELVHLGGDGPMRGFLTGRLVGRSAITAAVQWRWPICVWLDGFLLAEVGNVFGPHLRGFETRALRASGTTGIRTNTESPYVLELITGIATDTFDAGARVESFRLGLTATRNL